MRHQRQRGTRSILTPASSVGRGIVVVVVGAILAYSYWQKSGDAPSEILSPAESLQRSIPEDSGVAPSERRSELQEIRRDVFRSPAGLIYGPGSQHGHRLKHVMAHTRDEFDRPGQHGVFAAQSQPEIVALLDEAYRLARDGRDVVTRQDRQRTVHTVHMRRIVGYVGGQVGNRRGRPNASHVRLVLEGKRVITAYPMIP